MTNFSDKNWLIAVIFNKWSILIISALLKSDYQKLRPSEIRKNIKNLTQAELSKRMIELEKFGIVEKKTFAEVPPRVEYRITKFGETLRCVIDGIRDWVEINGEKISYSNFLKYDVEKKFLIKSSSVLRTFPSARITAADKAISMVAKSPREVPV